MRILVLTRYERLGSSSRVRFYQYFPYLQSQGVELSNAPFFTDRYVQNLYAGQKTSLISVFQAYLRRISALIRKTSFDLLWVEKEFLPWFPGEIERIFSSRKIPYVVDYDDAVFHRYDMHNFPPVRWLLGNKIDQVMKHADLVIAGNDYLIEYARMAGARKIEYLPSVVDVQQYAKKIPDKDSTFKIGWVGSPVTTSYLDIVRGAIDVLNQESNVRLILVGAENDIRSFSAPTEILPWDETIERTVNQKFDVGIMPLVDGPFERGKCGYKLIQYMAGGLPVIASPVGVNNQIVESGVNGYLANSTEDWISALRILRDYPQRRTEMGMASLQKAERLYNLEVTAPKLLNLLVSTAKK